MSKPLDESTRAKVVSLYVGGLLPWQIKERLGVSKRTIHKVLDKAEIAKDKTGTKIWADGT